MTPWMIVAGDFTPLGGMDAANYALARFLAGHTEVHVVTHRAWPDLANLPTVTVHRVWRPFERHMLGAPLLARSGRRLSTELRGRGPRIVVNGGNCRIAGVNWVHYLHAAFTPLSAERLPGRVKTALLHRLHLREEQTALAGARLVICNSHRTRRDVVERYGLDDSRVHVVYYGCDPKRLFPVTDDARTAARTALGRAADRRLVGFVGALGDRRKAFDTVFAAWTMLCSRREWDADLVVVGAGAELNAWRARAREANVADRIHFLGFRRDVPEVIAAFDAIVHPARYEAYGLVVNEALCRGIPALVSAAAGVAEHYGNDLSELLIEDSNSPAELHDRLRVWRENTDRFRSLVTPISAARRAHTWDAMAKQITCLVEQAA